MNAGIRNQRSLRVGCLIVLCTLAMNTSAAEPESLEYAVKAAYLVKFGIYVEWPSSAFATPDAPLEICVVGDDPFGQLLTTAARSQHVGPRRVSVRHLSSGINDRRCHIVYVSASEAGTPGQALAPFHRRAVLTIADADRSRAPGMITFVIDEGRVRFEIDDAAASDAGLKISSRLLSLAINVKRRTEK